MSNFKLILILLIAFFIIIPVYAQVKPALREIKTISGTVVNIDSVGNVITIKTRDQIQMAFIVMDKASITLNANDIGLMEISESDPVTIQYYISYPGKYTAISIVDNKPVASE